MVSTYGKLAMYYDLIYSFKDYKKEANQIVELVNQNKKLEGNQLLEAGCGTGKHLIFLKEYFECEGFDLNKDMIEVATKTVQGVKFGVANMIDFNFNKTYDIITCLFSSFAYVETLDNAEKTIENFANHLKYGGVLIIESWFAPDEFKDGRIGLNTYEDEQLKIARTTYSYKSESLSVIEMQFLVAEKGKGIRHFSDVHKMGLFEHNRIKALMEQHGFEVKIIDGLIGRKLYLGIKG
jgi:ubiquinone/menaquinone biosynthesis C-methylase UbiE